jgi:cell division septal protein FtsQ
MDYGVRPAPAHARRLKRNRKRRDWNQQIRKICAVIACVEILVFLLAYPGFRVRNVRIEGLETMTAGQAFAAAHVPEKTNIFMMSMFHPLARNLERLPVIDHATRVIELPNTIVLRVAERHPYAVLQSSDSYYLIDKKRVPYASVDGPVAGLPTIRAADLAAADPVNLGTPIHSDWLIQAYNLLSLLSDKESLQPKLITVDQNANLCLNRQDNLRINIGTPDDLPAKVWSAEVIARAIGSHAPYKAKYVDVSCPTHTALMLRHGKAETGHA